jgi:hypothetical protein
LEFYLEDIDVDISLETSIVERVNIHHPIWPKKRSADDLVF